MLTFVLVRVEEAGRLGAAGRGRGQCVRGCGAHHVVWPYGRRAAPHTPHAGAAAAASLLTPLTRCRRRCLTLSQPQSGTGGGLAPNGPLV